MFCSLIHQSGLIYQCATSGLLHVVQLFLLPWNHWHCQEVAFSCLGSVHLILFLGVHIIFTFIAIVMVAIIPPPYSHEYFGVEYHSLITALVVVTFNFLFFHFLRM